MQSTTFNPIIINSSAQETAQIHKFQSSTHIDQQTNIDQPICHDIPPGRIRINQPKEQAKPEDRSCWSRLTRKQKIGVGIGVGVTAALVVFGIVGLMTYYYMLKGKVNLDYSKAKEYKLPGSNQSITKIPATSVEPHLFKPNQVTKGYFTTVSGGKGKKVQGFPVVHDKQTGITVKYLNRTNQVIQIDPSQLLKYYYNSRPIQAKRLLAYLHLTRDLQEQPQTLQSRNHLQQLLNDLVQQTGMVQYDTVIQVTKQHTAVDTGKGFNLDHNHASRLEEFASSRKLFFGKVVGTILGGLIGETGKMQSGGSVSTVTTTNYNTNINTYNVGPRATMVVGNGNTVVNNRAVTNNNFVTNNQFSFHRAGRRSLAAQNPPTPTQQQDQVSLGLFKSALTCTDIDESTKRCPAEVWQSQQSPYVLSQQSKKNKGNYRVEHIYVIGLAELLTVVNPETTPKL